MSPAWNAVLVGCGLAAAVASSGSVSGSGAIFGAGLAAIYVYRGGTLALAGFAALVVLGVASTRIGYARKLKSGVAQDRGGKRGALHALANAGPGAVGLFLFDGQPALVFALGSLVGALSDTVSSEIGLLSKTPPRRFLFGRQVPAGTDGAMSWLGTSAGAMVAISLGLIAWWAVERRSFGLSILLGGLAANGIDSLLGALVERRLPARFGNEIVNALSALCGGIVAYVLFHLATGER